MKIVIEKTRTVRETIIAQVPVSRKYPRRISMNSIFSSTNRFAVIFRAYNDGVSYRIRTSFKDTIIVSNETAAFNSLRWPDKRMH
jgi:alpha-glucosidase